jgi:hypothetical protein
MGYRCAVKVNVLLQPKHLLVTSRIISLPLSNTLLERGIQLWRSASAVVATLGGLKHYLQKDLMIIIQRVLFAEIEFVEHSPQLLLYKYSYIGSAAT